MAISFNLYPTMTPDFNAKLGLHHMGLNLTYFKDREIVELNLETADSTGRSYTVSDGKNLWDPEDYELTVYKEYMISNPSFMFGENGVCPRSSTLGLAMIWSCKGTNSRGVIVIDEIDISTQGDRKYFFKHTFPKGTLRNTLDLELIIYLKKIGNLIQKHEKIFAGIEGLTLGSIDSTKIVIDGNASMFPIVTVDEPSQPLWWVNLDYNDPTEDLFSVEYISLKINKAHKDYKKLETVEGIAGNPLLIEIMASAVQIIVNALKKSPYWENIVSKNQIDPGSIAEAICYILETYELKDLSEEQFARTLRMKLGEW